MCNQARCGVAVVVALLVFLSAMRLGAEGEIKNLKEYEYRESGTPWKCTVYDAKTGRLKGKLYYAGDGTVEKMERFDKRGNRVEAAFYTSAGRLKNGADGWAARRWLYRDTALMLEIVYDEGGNPIERLFYSESGKLVMRQYRNDDSVNPYVNAAMYMMLGGNNVAYYDPHQSYNDTMDLLKD